MKHYSKTPLKILPITKCSSTNPEVLCENTVLKNFAKFTGNHLYRNLFLIKNTIFIGHLWGTASVV